MPFSLVVLTNLPLRKGRQVKRRGMALDSKRVTRSSTWRLQGRLQADETEP